MSNPQKTPKPKKIVWLSSLILDTHFHKTTQIEVLRALAKRGHKVFLFGSYSSKKDSKELDTLNSLIIPLRHVPFLSAAVYVCILLLYMPFFLLRFKPDFVIVESDAAFFSILPVSLVPRRKTPKIILDNRTTPVHIFGIAGYLRWFVFNLTITMAKKRSQGMTIITEMMKNEVCASYRIDPKFLGVWTSGVSTTAFTPKNQLVTEMRKELGLEGKFVILYHGTFAGSRGLIETVKAIEILKGTYPNLVLFLLGNGHKLKIANVVRELNLQNIVILHDRVNYTEVPKYVAMCDVGIVPLPNSRDWRHQCPLNLLEYLAMEKVVIATDIPANREILGKNKYGIFAPTANPKDIAAAIVYAYTNRTMLKKWGANGRRLVLNKYSWTKVAEDFETYLLHC